MTTGGSGTGKGKATASHNSAHPEVKAARITALAGIFAALVGPMVGGLWTGVLKYTGPGSDSQESVAALAEPIMFVPASDDLVGTCTNVRGVVPTRLDGVFYWLALRHDDNWHIDRRIEDGPTVVRWDANVGVGLPADTGSFEIAVVRAGNAVSADFTQRVASAGNSHAGPNLGANLPDGATVVSQVFVQRTTTSTC